MSKIRTCPAVSTNGGRRQPPAAPWIAALVTLAGGCAGPADDPAADVTDPGSPCAVCTVTFDVCRKADDYNPCLAMRRSCVNWCVSAQTCAEGCEGAQWGCESVIDLRRSTCDKTAKACAEFCGTARMEPP